MSTFLRNSSKNIFITCTSHSFRLFRTLVSSWLCLFFVWFSSNKKNNIFYDTKHLQRKCAFAIKTLGLWFANLNLESSVSCPTSKHSCSFVAALSSMHLPSLPKLYDLESSFLEVLYTKHICLDDGNLFRVNAISEWKKGNNSVHGKADNFWRHQRFGAKTLIP